MKNGCGKSVTKGHGAVAVCGKDYYGGIYTCDSCLSLRVAELEAVLRECREVIEEAQTYCEGPQWSPSMAHDCGTAIAKIDEVLK